MRNSHSQNESRQGRKSRRKEQEKNERTSKVERSTKSGKFDDSAMMVIFLLVVLALVQSASGLVHHLNIHKDDRHIFKIEMFGFVAGGQMDIRVSNFGLQQGKNFHNLTRPSNSYSEVDMEPQRRLASKLPYKAGFVMRHAESESLAQQDLEYIIERNECIFNKLQPDDVVLDMSDTVGWKSSVLQHEVTQKGIGFYSLIFAQCSPAGPLLVSFKLDASFYNPGPNYLSAGDAPLPAMYFAFFLVFSALMAVWVRLMFCSADATVAVHKIHYFMLALIVLKCLTLLCESIRFYYISKLGVSETWNAIYYIFATLKGIVLFVVILLIGMGYSLIKNFLSDQDKRIIFAVLVLQVIDNVAMIVLEEMAPGSVNYLTWRDVLHLVDIICCFAILLPIVWSIRHLRQAAEVDGKAHNNLTKLTQFRHFYIVTLVYIYFTRIAVYLLEATVPFYLLWLGPFSSEIATLVFYTTTGYSFRPCVDNPYLPVKTEDTEGQEYGLDDEDESGFELPKRTTGSA